MKKRWIILLLVSFLYIAVKVSLSDFNATMVMKDSHDYMVYPSWRPVTIPFLFHFFHGPHAIVWFQWATSSIAWLSLAWALYWCVNPYLVGTISACVTLLFSLSHSILQWDFAVLSESLSFSFLALMIASIMVLYKLYTSGRMFWTILFFIIAVVPILFFFINTRDANSYLVLLLVPLFLIVFLDKKRLQQYMILAALFVVFSAGIYINQSHSATNNDRWEMPLRHVIFSRILTDQESLSYFKDKGMPVSSDLMALKGQAKADVPKSIKKDFDSWLSKHGKTVYMEYMMTHPFKTFHAFLVQLPSAINYPVIVKYYGQVNLGGLSHRLNAFFFNRTAHPLRWILLLTAIPLILLIINRKQWRVHVISLIMTGAFVSQAYIGYMGDAIEGVRHSLMGDVLYRFSIYTLLLSLFYWSYSYWNQSGNKGRVR